MNTLRHSDARVMLPLGIGIALSLLGDSTLYTVLPKADIAAEAGVTLAMVGTLLGINRLIRALFNPVAGLLYDRLPRKMLLVASLGFGTISTWVYALGNGFPVILMGRILWGLAWAGLWIGGTTVVLDIAEDHNRGRLSGQFQTWFFLGVGLSAFLGGLFTDTFGFRGGLALSGSINLITFILWIFFLPETRPMRTTENEAAQDKVPINFPWRIILEASLPIFAIRFVFAGVLASTTILWLSVLFKDLLIPPKSVLPIATLTGAFVAVRTTTSMAGGPIIGYLSDRLRTRWGLMALMFTVGAIGFWMMGSPAWITALIGGLIASVAGGGIQSLVPAIVGDHVDPSQTSRSLSFIFTIGDVGSALGPLLALNLVSILSISRIYQGCALFFLGLMLIWIMNGIQKR